MSNLTRQQPLPGRGTGFHVARDGYFIAVPENTQGTALVVQTFWEPSGESPPTFQSYLDGSVSGARLIEMGEFDALEIMVLGTNSANDLINTLVTAINPVWPALNASASVNKLHETAPSAFIQRFVASHVWTLGALTAGANGALVSGLDSGDFWADTVVATNAGTEGYVTYSPADDKIAFVQMPMDQAKYALIETDISTGAASSIVIARRIMGAAQR